MDCTYSTCKSGSNALGTNRKSSYSSQRNACSSCLKTRFLEFQENEKNHKDAMYMKDIKEFIQCVQTERCKLIQSSGRRESRIAELDISVAAEVKDVRFCEFCRGVGDCDVSGRLESSLFQTSIQKNY